MTLPLPDLTLRRGEDRRLRAGHPWVFSNEVDNERTPLKAFTPGEPVCLRAADGRAIGTAYVNPHSLICARLMSRDPARAPDGSLLVHRLNLALALRERLFDAPYYRLVHGEGDGLPGLVVDRFGDTVVAQINTAGMEHLREALVEALHRVLRPRHILLRADSAMRELEGLDRYVAWAGDSGPDTLDVAENGARFTVPASGGQKTGWYYDHTANRARMMPLVAGRRVLDLYGYVGAWGIEAAVAGAAEVLTVDASRDAAEWAGRNAGWNGVDDRVSVACGDVLEVLAALREDRERFDVVIADPPAFIKRRKDHRQGLRAYRRLNQAAMQVLGHDGLLISASCSAHLEGDELRSTLLASARHLDRSLQIVDFGRQGPDHPVHPALPETDYIKVITARVLPADSQI